MGDVRGTCMTRVKADVRIGPDRIKSLIKKHYSLKTLSIEKVRGVYKVETSSGVYGFKNAEELPDLPFIAGCLQKLKENGFTRIPGFLLTKNGEFLIHDHDGTYFMEEWLDFLKEVPRKSFPYLKKIGEALADFHNASLNIPVPNKENFRFQWGKRHNFLQKAFHYISNWKQQDSRRSFSPYFSLEYSILDFLHERCWLAYEWIKDVQSVPQSAVWCHGSLHHKNIMLDPQEQIWFIDFEKMVYSERVLDLAQLLQYHAFPYSWNLKVVQTFLQAYSSRVSVPVDQEEWKMFVSHLVYPRRLYTIMKRYFGSPTPQFEYLAKLRDIVDWEKEKEKLLTEIHTIFI